MPYPVWYVHASFEMVDRRSKERKLETIDLNHLMNSFC